MTDEALMHLVISLTGGAFVGFVVHLALNSDDDKPKPRPKKKK